MNTKLLRLAALTILGLWTIAAADTAPDHHMLSGAGAVQWGPPPPVFPAGAKGLMMSAGYKIAPHWHPTDEHITVLSGTLGIGMGDTLEAAHGQTLKACGYAVAPANMHHYAWTKTGANIQVHLNGPFALTAGSSSRSGSRQHPDQFA